MSETLEQESQPKRRRGSDVVFFLMGIIAAAVVAVYVAMGATGRNVRVMGVLFIFVLITIVLVTFSIRHTRRRKAEFHRAVSDLGLDVIPVKTVGKEFGKAWNILPDLTKSGKMHVILVGELDGRELTIFEHRYTTMAGNTPVTISHSVYSIPVPGWPEMHITRPTFFSKVSSPLKKEFDVKTGDPAFDGKFNVRCRAPDFPRLILSGDVRQLIQKNPRVYWRVIGDRFCMIEKAAISAKNLGPRIALLERFWHALPSSVRGEIHMEYEVAEY